MKSEFDDQHLALECVEFVLRDSSEDNVKFESMLRLRSATMPKQELLSNDFSAHTLKMLNANNFDVSTQVSYLASYLQTDLNQC